MEGGSGPRSGAHNKQMFIIGGFTISDPDCITIISIFTCYLNFNKLIITKLSDWNAYSMLGNSCRQARIKARSECSSEQGHPPEGGRHA